MQWWAYDGQRADGGRADRRAAGGDLPRVPHTAVRSSRHDVSGVFTHHYYYSLILNSYLSSRLLCATVIKHTTFSTVFRFSFSCYWTYPGLLHLWYIHVHDAFYGRAVFLNGGQSFYQFFMPSVSSWFMPEVWVRQHTELCEITASPWLHQRNDWISIHSSLYPAKRLKKKTYREICALTKVGQSSLVGI